jgi:hypothetical protein
VEERGCDGMILKYMTVVARDDTSLLYEFRVQRTESNHYSAGRIYYVTETCEDTYRYGRKRDEGHMGING